MRKKVLLGCTLLLLVALIAGGTAAYLNQGEAATNVISMGKISIRLNDKGEDRKTDFPTETISVMPGMSTPKHVWVTNTGADAWIRLKVTMTVTKNGDSMSDTIPVEGEQQPVCTLGLAGDSWTYQDGCYYYTAMTPAGQDTKDLFSSVSFNPALPNAYQGCVVKIDLDAQAVQYKNNNAAGGVTQVKGWPQDGADTKTSNVAPAD